MKYEDMSDWEIDLQVHMAVSGLEPVDAEPNERQRVYIARDFDNEHHPPETARQYVDVKEYCNNPSDAWDIIVENEICINAQHTGDGYWSATYDDTNSVSWIDEDPMVFARDKNPLRAAMICFLKMKEAENA